MGAIEEMFLDPHVAEVWAKAQATPPGSTVFWKWTCNGCGERAASDEENILHTSYKHSDCGYETRTVDGDLGFALLLQKHGGKQR